MIEPPQPLVVPAVSTSTPATSVHVQATAAATTLAPSLPSSQSLLGAVVQPGATSTMAANGILGPGAGSTTAASDASTKASSTMAASGTLPGAGSAMTTSSTFASRAGFTIGANSARPGLVSMPLGIAPFNPTESLGFGVGSFPFQPLTNNLPSISRPSAPSRPGAPSTFWQSGPMHPGSFGFQPATLPAVSVNISSQPFVTPLASLDPERSLATSHPPLTQGLSSAPDSISLAQHRQPPPAGLQPQRTTTSSLVTTQQLPPPSTSSLPTGGPRFPAGTLPFSAKPASSTAPGPFAVFTTAASVSTAPAGSAGMTRPPLLTSTPIPTAADQTLPTSNVAVGGPRLPAFASMTGPFAGFTSTANVSTATAGNAAMIRPPLLTSMSSVPTPFSTAAVQLLPPLPTSSIVNGGPRLPAVTFPFSTRPATSMQGSSATFTAAAGVSTVPAGSAGMTRPPLLTSTPIPPPVSVAADQRTVLGPHSTLPNGNRPQDMVRLDVAATGAVPAMAAQAAAKGPPPPATLVAKPTSRPPPLPKNDEKSSTELAKKHDAAFSPLIDKEIRKFSAELKMLDEELQYEFNLMPETGSDDNDDLYVPRLGCLGKELPGINEEHDICENEIKQISDEIKVLETKVTGVHDEVLRGFELGEEARIRLEKANDPKHKEMAMLQPLDPQNARKMDEIRNKFSQIDHKLRDVNHQLNAELEHRQNQERHRGRHPLVAPGIQNVYTTLRNHKQIIRIQTAALERLARQMKRAGLIPQSWTPRHPEHRYDDTFDEEAGSEDLETTKNTSIMSASTLGVQPDLPPSTSSTFQRPKSPEDDKDDKERMKTLREQLMKVRTTPIRIFKRREVLPSRVKGDSGLLPVSAVLRSQDVDLPHFPPDPSAPHFLPDAPHFPPDAPHFPHDAPRFPLDHSAPCFPPDHSGPRFPPDQSGPRFPPDHSGPRFPPGHSASRFPPDHSASRFPPDPSAPRFPPPDLSASDNTASVPSETRVPMDHPGAILTNNNVFIPLPHGGTHQISICRASPLLSATFTESSRKPSSTQPPPTVCAVSLSQTGLATVPQHPLSSADTRPLPGAIIPNDQIHIPFSHGGSQLSNIHGASPLLSSTSAGLLRLTKPAEPLPTTQPPITDDSRVPFGTKLDTAPTHFLQATDPSVANGSGRNAALAMLHNAALSASSLPSYPLHPVGRHAPPHTISSSSVMSSFDPSLLPSLHHPTVTSMATAGPASCPLDTRPKVATSSTVPSHSTYDYHLMLANSATTATVYPVGAKPTEFSTPTAHSVIPSACASMPAPFPGKGHVLGHSSKGTAPLSTRLVVPTCKGTTASTMLTEAPLATAVGSADTTQSTLPFPVTTSFRSDPVVCSGAASAAGLGTAVNTVGVVVTRSTFLDTITPTICSNPMVFSATASTLSHTIIGSDTVTCSGPTSAARLSATGSTADDGIVTRSTVPDTAPTFFRPGPMVSSIPVFTFGRPGPTGTSTASASPILSSTTSGPPFAGAGSLFGQQSALLSFFPKPSTTSSHEGPPVIGGTSSATGTTVSGNGGGQPGSGNQLQPLSLNGLGMSTAPSTGSVPSTATTVGSALTSGVKFSSLPASEPSTTQSLPVVSMHPSVKLTIPSSTPSVVQPVASIGAASSTGASSTTISTPYFLVSSKTKTTSGSAVTQTMGKSDKPPTCIARGATTTASSVAIPSSASGVGSHAKPSNGGRATNDQDVDGASAGAKSATVGVDKHLTSPPVPSLPLPPSSPSSVSAQDAKEREALAGLLAVVKAADASQPEPESNDSPISIGEEMDNGEPIDADEPFGTTGSNGGNGFFERNVGFNMFGLGNQPPAGASSINPFARPSQATEQSSNSSVGRSPLSLGTTSLGASGGGFFRPARVNFAPGGVPGHDSRPSVSATGPGGAAQITGMGLTSGLGLGQGPALAFGGAPVFGGMPTIGQPNQPVIPSRPQVPGTAGVGAGMGNVGGGGGLFSNVTNQPSFGSLASTDENVLDQPEPEAMGVGGGMGIGPMTGGSQFNAYR